MSLVASLGVNAATREDVCHRVAVVLIGRNEGARLVLALRALEQAGLDAVYVDSGSTDNSLEEAHDRGVEVVELDMSRPFTAARARNAGFDRVRECWPERPYVLFIDGDCAVESAFVKAAVRLFDKETDVVAVVGYRRERYPGNTIYNAICDVEWREGEVGDIEWFGGDAMMRSSALHAIEGYDSTLIAGEDHEVGLRLRHAGGRLVRINAVSTVHDADMRRLGQWWKRAQRAGHAYAELHARHGKDKFRPEVRRIWVHGVWIPLAIAVGTWFSPWALAGVLLYPARVMKVWLHTLAGGYPAKQSFAWALSCVGGSWPQLIGLLQYHTRPPDKLAELIEYK